MNLTDALAQSRPPSLTQQKAHLSLPGKGTVAVLFDGVWCVMYQGCPIPYWSQGDVFRFIKREGISLQEGWMPQMAECAAV